MGINERTTYTKVEDVAKMNKLSSVFEEIKKIYESIENLIKYLEGISNNKINVAEYYFYPMIENEAMKMKMAVQEVVIEKGVKNIIDATKFKGNLIEVEDIFNEKISYDIKNFEDYKTLSAGIFKLASKFNKWFEETNTKIIPEMVKYYENLTIILENLEVIRYNASEKESRLETLKETAQSVNSIFNRLYEQDVKFSMSKVDLLNELKIMNITNDHRNFLNSWTTESLGRTPDFQLIYQATKDGFTSQDFHRKCDNKSILVVIQSNNNYVFGGFTKVGFDPSKIGNYTNDPNAFLFTLTNPYSIQPTKYLQKNTNSIYYNSSYGPIFGGGHDLYVSNNSNTSNSSSSFGSTYNDTTGRGPATFTGGQNFTIKEIMVFSV